VNYTYDNADRLTQISQATSNTSFTYDNANRRVSLTLPNNVVVSYSYDHDSRLTGINYQFGSAALGNLSYSYDQLGRRTQVGGSFARTGLPGGVTAAFYDAANEVTNWNGLTLSYDQNGNMLSDGANTFTWNARNQVAKVNNISLQYDAFGRRIQNAAGTSFVYAGANAAQELSGSTVTANLLSGGIDEIFSRADSSGALAQLRDALGSTVALVDSIGNLQSMTASTVTTPYSGTPTAEVVEEALQSVQRATAAEEAAAATTAGTGTTLAVGGTLVAGGVATGAIVYYGTSAAIAVHHENQAYENELEAIHQYNLAILAGRKNKRNGTNCDARYSREQDFCRTEYSDYPKLLSGCLDRAFWRWNNCKKGAPDPGPLDPLDPNWRWD
jgi:YD repeat-containing protein